MAETVRNSTNEPTNQNYVPKTVKPTSKKMLSQCPLHPWVHYILKIHSKHDKRQEGCLQYETEKFTLA